MKIIYRQIKESEYQFLEEMLYEALFVPKGKPEFPKSIIETPAIKKYVALWNKKKDDIAIVAIIEEKLVGAIWARKFNVDQKGYGYVNEETPEVSMAVKLEYRNRGIGTELLKQIEIKYLELGIAELSLSVDKLNPAKLLYERNGYKIHKEVGTAITMIKKINKAS